MKVNENNNKNQDNLKNQTRTPHTILVVEDDKSFAALIYKKLQQEGYHTEWASTGSEALSWLTENPCTLMLLDYQLPDMTGQQVIYSITEQRRNVPFILMTAHGNEKLAVKMMKLGARDYLVKDQGFRNLLPVITKQVIEQLETEKKLTEAEDALKRSEEKYRMLIENMPDGIYRSTPCGKFIEVNHALIKMLGYDSYEEVMNLNIPQDLYFAPAEREKALALLQHEECPKTTILRLKKKDGSELWVEDHGRIVYDQNGKKLYYEGVLRDITVRKKVEDALRESEMRFRAVTQSANEAIISSNSHGNIITWNLGAQTIFGYREEEVLGKPLTLLMPDRYHEAHRKGMERVLSTGEKNVIGKTIELPGLRKDGTEFPMEVSLAAWETEEGTFYSGILRDITERKRTTEVLKESEEKFRGLAEHSPNMIFINRKGRIIYANKTCEEMMGYTREEFHDPDFDFFTLIAPESKDIIKENFCRHLKGEEIPPYEYTLITKDGKRLNAINTTKLINYEGAKGILGIITDITERKQAEEALRKAEEKYRSIFENVHEGIYQSTPDGHALTANPRLAQIFGYNSPEELIADVTNIGEQFYVDPERNKEFKRLMKKQGSVFGFESQMYRKDGSIVWISENARTICDASGKVLIYEGTMEDITERKLAEEELRKSEARLAEAQRIANLGSWEWDVKNNKLLWSDETYRIFGLRPNEFGATYEAFLATVHPEDRDIIEKAVAEKRSINFDHRIIRPDGQERIVHEQGEIVVDKTREMIRIFGTVLDITERKRAEEALAQERHLLNHFIENIPDAIYFKDQEGHFLRVNKTQAARLHLNDPEEALGKTDFDFFSDEDARLAYEEELRVMQTGQISINERKKVYPNGKECWVQTTKVPMFDEEGKIMGVFGLTRDTTARKNVEEALRRVHTETEQLLAAISSILIGVGADNRITRWNATAESAFGIKSSKILGKPFQKSGIHWDWNMIMQSISESLDKMQPMRLDDIRYLRADGKDGFLGLTITPIVSDAHEKKGFLILAADITERKTLECQLAQAQKLESIGQLAAGIAHEINTPTQYVGDNARFLQVAFGRLKNVLHINHELLKAAKENAITKELIAEADSIVEDTKMTYIVDEIPMAIQETLDGVDRVANIVRAMKEYAHPDADEMTLTDINKALENTITVACNEWKYVAEMVTEFDPSLPLVPCLPGKLNQVFLNLIVNAVHAISDVVGDGSAGKGIIKVSTGYERDWVEIKISDSGTGIPEEFRPKIFDPFFTSKEVGKGTGQGLSISHNVIVEKHGGSITFETEIGKGTTFIIRLPINSTNHLIETSNEKTNPVCR